MKLSQLSLALSVSISGAAFAADNHGHDLKPMHGGAVAERDPFALADPHVRTYTSGKTVKKVVVAKGRLVSVVVQ